jgi:hypothetical protein
MIAKISRGTAFGGLGRYLYGPGRREEHTDPHAVAGDGVVVDDRRGWRPWVADMRWAASLRPDAARPVWHCALRAAPADPVLPDRVWAAIATAHVQQMGLGAFLWVAVRHAPDHVHVVACRVDERGRLWRDSHDYARAMRSARLLEEAYGLTRLPRSRRARRPADNGQRGGAAARLAAQAAPFVPPVRPVRSGAGRADRVDAAAAAAADRVRHARNAAAFGGSGGAGRRRPGVMER